MNDCIKDKMATILLGRATIRDKQDVLARVGDAEFEEIINDSQFKETYEHYLANHKDYTLSNITLSKEQIDQSWDRIVNRSFEDAPAHVGLLSKVKETWAQHFPAERFFQRHAAVMAVLCICIAVPTLYYHAKPQITDSISSMRGPEVSQKATLEYSILGKDNKLHRPDRELHEKDTLFFRVDATEDGFCSLYIIHQEKADIIVSDHFLKKGVHDLSTGYKLTGNKGENRLVLVFSSYPVPMDREYIVASINNKVRSLTVNDTLVSIFQTELRVE